MALQLLGLACYQTSSQHYHQKGQETEPNLIYEAHYLRTFIPISWDV